MNQVPFSFAVWADVALQPEQIHEPPTEAYAERLARDGVAFAVADDEGHTIGVGGLYPVGPGQAVAWTYIGRDAGPYMLPIIRTIRAVLKQHENRWPLVRATVIKDFAAGERLIRMLGFQPLLPSEPLMFGARVYSVWQRVGYGGH